MGPPTTSIGSVPVVLSTVRLSRQSMCSKGQACGTQHAVQSRVVPSHATDLTYVCLSTYAAALFEASNACLLFPSLIFDAHFSGICPVEWMYGEDGVVVVRHSFVQLVVAESKGDMTWDDGWDLQRHEHPP